LKIVRKILREGLKLELRNFKFVGVVEISTIGASKRRIERVLPITFVAVQVAGFDEWSERMLWGNVEENEDGELVMEDLFPIAACIDRCSPHTYIPLRCRTILPVWIDLGRPLITLLEADDVELVLKPVIESVQFGDITQRATKSVTSFPESLPMTSIFFLQGIKPWQ
jgi:hypothetical protein